jgi:predicted metalloprotease with PDZ domain
VDARDVARRLLHVRETLPAAPGTLALAYPEWLPGEHAPTGPLTEMMGLHVSAHGQPLPWRRDPVDLYTIRVEVPKGASAVNVAFDFALTTSTAGYSSAASATDQLLLLSWNQVLLSPAGKPSDALTYRAVLRLPTGWRWGTPLHGIASGDSIAFEPVTLTRLVDSPVLTGAHFRRVDLAPGAAVPYTLDMACDSEEGLAIPDSLVTVYRALVREGRALFGGGHHREYHFLLTLSDHVPEFGLEHAECSDDRVPERTWLEDDARRVQAELLAHEFVHSWCGKYRRPAGLATPDYGKPMRDELLWVYEGLTQYLGFVLSARCGARDVPSSLDHFARTTALEEMTRGREWRPLVDTAVEASRLYEARNEWELARRSVDFYDEGALLWLEVDVTIRRLTHGRKSLDDFCRRFMGGDGPPAIVPYERADVVAALEAVAPDAWDRFFTERIDAVQPHAPLGGLTDGGWTLVYGDTASDEWRAEESHGEYLDERCSVGVWLEEKTGLVKDVTPGSAADRAGLSPDMVLVAVNGRRWSKDLLRDAIRSSRSGGPVDLLVTSGDFFRTLHVDDHAGPRYPRLERLPGTPDVLGAILAPLTTKDAR